MELATKIFVFIGIIFGAILIFPIVFGFIALKKIKNNDYSILWGVLTLIFCNLVAGILMIVRASKEKA